MFPKSLLRNTLICAMIVGSIKVSADPDTPYLQKFTDYIEWLSLADKGVGSAQWSKFLFEIGTQEIYFQNVKLYPLHYDFASRHLNQFKNMNPVEFTQKTLRSNGRLAYVGSILMTYTNELSKGVWGIQIVSLDKLTVDEIDHLHQTVRRGMEGILNGDRLFLIPTVEQRDDFREIAPLLNARSIELLDPNELYGKRVDQIYSEGFAVGRLLRSSAETINSDFKSGKINPEDIVIIDHVLSEMPPVSGIISKDLSVPSSHTALLFRQKSKPFAFSSDSKLLTLLDSLLGKEIFYGIYNGQILIQTSDQGLSESWIERLKTLRESKVSKPPFKDIVDSSIKRTGTYGRSDANVYGAKSANYSELQRILGESIVLPGVGIPFYYYEQFLQSRSDEKSLKEHIEELTQKYEVVRDREQLSTDLVKLQERMIRTPISSDLYEKIVTGIRAQFSNDSQMLFLRSSTNAEDGDEFNGAGLYSSKSGRICDDLETCEPLDGKRKPLSMALKKVWASLFNLNAFLAYKEFGIDPLKVAMGVLVNPFHSEVQANGVAVTISSGRYQITSQKDLIEVTNPDPGFRPEMVTLFLDSNVFYHSIEQTSSLLPVGWTVLSRHEYHDLALALDRVYKLYRTYVQLPLDFEWLKLKTGQVVLTQVRPIPESLANSKMRELPLLVFGGKKQGLRSCVGESQDAARFLRSKIAISLDRDLMFFNEDGSRDYLHNMEFTVGEKANQLYRFDHIDDLPNIRTGFKVLKESDSVDWQTGRPLIQRLEEISHAFQLPEAPKMILKESHETRRDKTSRLLQDPFAFQMTSYKPYLGSKYPTFNQLLELHYDSLPVDAFPNRYRWNQDPNDQMNLCSYEVESGLLGKSNEDMQVQSQFISEAIQIHMDHYVTDPRLGSFHTYFVTPIETTFVGVASQPFTIKSWFASAHAPDHHNFSEEFLFDIEKEPSISQMMIEELRTLGIRWLSLSTGYQQEGNPTGYTLIAFDAFGNRRILSTDLRPHDFPFPRNFQPMSR